MDIAVTIEGISPLLLNSFTTEAQQSATEGNRSSAAASDRGTPHEQAESHLYVGLSGHLVIPQRNMLSCIIEAGKYFKAGKTKITTMRSSLIPAAVQIYEIELLLESREGWTVDSQPVTIPSTGGRVLRHRPKFHDWKVSFTADLDVSEISEKLFRDIVDAAGKKVGLGDFRPSRKGSYGRFTVTSWAAERVVPLKSKRAA